jgi:hypothetical protein
MSIYGNSWIKWSFGPLVYMNREAFPSGFPYGFFGLFGNFAIRYDTPEVQ